MAHFIYGTATNTGKGFFTAEDRRAFFLRGYPANVWCIGNNVEGARWLAEKNGVEKTKSEAQALITMLKYKLHKLLGMLKLTKKKLNQVIIDQAI
jgi:hypothetical protein